MNLKERAEFYNNSFPRFSKQAPLDSGEQNVYVCECGRIISLSEDMPLLATDRWIYGIWVIGNNYRSKQKYYGEYPPTYLNRMKSLFPEFSSDEILHLFSGVVDDGSDTFDINPDLNPTYVGNAEDIDKIVNKKYGIIYADPPYSEEDAKHYGQPLVSRNKSIKGCYNILKPNGFLIWLDQIFPMFRKIEFNVIGTIGIVRSTNHRFRIATIFQKVIKEPLIKGGVT